MNKPMKYQVALLKDGGPTIYESTSVIASDNNQALKKASGRLRSITLRKMLVQIASSGVGIRSLRPGEVLMVQRRMYSKPRTWRGLSR